MISTILGLIGSLSSAIRWDEPWDLEVDDDPLLERTTDDDTASWG